MTAQYLTKEQRPFQESVFPAVTFNLGPKVETVEHFDSKNKAEGWLSVTALGNFNPRTGGHLILRDLGLVVEFPAGSTILFPSAIIRHGNVPVGPHERRASFTQFAAGGLFRYADYGFRTERELRTQDPDGWGEIKRKRKGAWKEAIKSYSEYKNLYKDRELYLYAPWQVD